MTVIKFSQKVVDSSHTITYELAGNDAKGRDAYYFIKVPLGKNNAFQQALKSGGFDLRQYGIIVASGYGTTIPEAIRVNVMNDNLADAV